MLAFHFASGSGPDFDPEPDEDSRKSAVDKTTFGTLIFIASTFMLFAGLLAGYLVIRVKSGEWGRYQLPGMELGLILSTVAILLCSFFLQRAMHAAKTGEQGRLVRCLRMAVIAALAFLTLQGCNWWRLLDYYGGFDVRDLSLFLFYSMTGLHALHLLGGLVPLGYVTHHANRGRYGPQNYRGVLNTALFWHFLDGTWLVILLVLLLG